MSKYADKHKTTPPCAAPNCPNEATKLRALSKVGVAWLCDDCAKEVE